MHYRQGTINDIQALKSLALKSWAQYKSQLTPDNWEKLHGSLNDSSTYTELLDASYCIVCVTGDDVIIGMGFLVPHGHPTDIYDSAWCYIRFVSVDPAFTGQGIGRTLTERCIQYAVASGEKTIALHTSEMMNTARHIYETLGFTILREIPLRLGKKYWLYTMQLA